MGSEGFGLGRGLEVRGDEVRFGGVQVRGLGSSGSEELGDRGRRDCSWGRRSLGQGVGLGSKRSEGLGSGVGFGK